MAEYRFGGLVEILFCTLGRAALLVYLLVVSTSGFYSIFLVNHKISDRLMTIKIRVVKETTHHLQGHYSCTQLAHGHAEF